MLSNIWISVKVLCERTFKRLAQLELEFRLREWTDRRKAGHPRHGVRTQWNACAVTKHCRDHNLLISRAQDTVK
jgi:hypothetical protein